MLGLRELTGLALKAHNYLVQKFPLPYLIGRILIAASSVFSMHVFGYAHRLGIGVKPFVGLEVAADLFSEVLYSVLATLVAFGVLLFFVTILMKASFRLLSPDAVSNPESVSFGLALLLAAMFFTNNYLDFTYWSGSFGYANSASWVLLPLIATVAGFALWWGGVIKAPLFAVTAISLLMSVSYFLGEIKAGSSPEYVWKQIVFLDDTRLDGFPLHRVADGIIFRKRDYFAFDTGAVFVPYSSIKFITEPSRDSSGTSVTSRDYPSHVTTAP